MQSRPFCTPCVLWHPYVNLSNLFFWKSVFILIELIFPSIETLRVRLLFFTSVARSILKNSSFYSMVLFKLQYVTEFMVFTLFSISLSNQSVLYSSIFNIFASAGIVFYKICNLCILHFSSSEMSLHLSGSKYTLPIF